MYWVKKIRVIGVFVFAGLFHFVRKILGAFYFHLSWEKRETELCLLLQNGKPIVPLLCLSWSASPMDSRKLQFLHHESLQQDNMGYKLLVQSEETHLYPVQAAFWTLMETGTRLVPGFIRLTISLKVESTN